MSADCPSIEVLAALIEGVFLVDNPALETHLADCGYCRTQLALALRLETLFNKTSRFPVHPFDAERLGLQPANF